MNNRDLIIMTLDEIEREGMDNVIDFLNTSDFFTAPASTMYHGNKKGGLAKHSWSVFSELMGMNQRDKLGIANESIVICGLLHDVCKVNTYRPNILKSTGELSTNKPYFVEDKLVLGHGEKSVAVLLALGLKLTEKEQMMIRWHMGPFDYQFKYNQKGIEKYCPEAIYLFLADYYSSRKERLS